MKAVLDYEYVQGVLKNAGLGDVGPLTIKEVRCMKRALRPNLKRRKVLTSILEFPLGTLSVLSVVVLAVAVICYVVLALLFPLHADLLPYTRSEVDKLGIMLIITAVGAGFLAWVSQSLQAHVIAYWKEAADWNEEPAPSFKGLPDKLLRVGLEVQKALGDTEKETRYFSVEWCCKGTLLKLVLPEQKRVLYLGFTPEVV